jgi:hypothetical protein
MWKDALLLTLSSVLFVQMGLSEAIQKFVGFRSTLLSCPRCVSFWSVLAWFIFKGYGILPSVATSFISAYSALWLSLLYDAIAVIYNRAYEKVSTGEDTEDTEPDEVSEVHPK